jgi:DNA-binding beta-propeller fold protein YncE
MTYKNLTTVLLASVCTALVLTPSSLTRVEAQAKQAPLFQADTGWPKLPNNWVFGTVTSVTVGLNDHIWIVHRPRTVPEAQRAQAAPAVLEFDNNGAFVKSWGGDGTGYDWPGAEHGIAADYKGNLWFTGSSPSGGSPTGPIDNMLLKFSRDGKFLLQIGGRDKPANNQDTMNVEKAADVDVYQKTNELFVADGYGNRRIAVFDADTGKFKRMWGAFGKAPDTDPPAPTSVASRAAAAARGAAGGGGGAGAGGGAGRGGGGGAAGGGGGRGAAAPADTSPDGPPQFGNPVHAVKVSKDGMVYVADRTNKRVQVFTVEGKYITQMFLNRSEQPSAAGLAFSPDAQQQYLYIADYGNSRVAVVDRKSLTVLYQFGKRSPAPGDFQGLHHLAADSKGNLYTAEVAPGNRAQRFIYKGMGTPPTQ